MLLEEKSASALASAKRLAHSLDLVRGVDFGFAYGNGTLTDTPSIRFHMHRKRSIYDVPRDQLLPNSINGVDVDVFTAGYMPHDGSARASHDILCPGVSIGNIKTKTTGTLGALVRDNSTKQLCILSNWHVLCGGPEAAIGDEISQPGPFDLGSQSPRTVARLERWLRLSEHFDAAVALVETGIGWDGQLLGTAASPAATPVPTLGMLVLKSGAVSGQTKGIVDGIGGSYRLDYTGFGDGPEWMHGCRIVPDPTASADAISTAGDSGSVWVDNNGEHVIGLHFAGEDDTSPLNDYALAHSINDVLTRLGFQLAT
jgi:hypothetical protein